MDNCMFNGSPVPERDGGQSVKAFNVHCWFKGRKRSHSAMLPLRFLHDFK